MVKNIFPFILTTLRLVKTLHENLKNKKYLIMLMNKKNQGLRKFHSSATRRWNGPEPSVIET